MKVWLYAGAAVGVLLLFSGCSLTRWGYETPKYKVVRKNGPFEIRDYPSLTVASTPIESAPGSDDGGFRRLFRYISGANRADAKIAMTTPVFMGLEGTNRQMSFIVPEKVAASGAPEATLEEIKIEGRTGGRFAVYRFRGSWRGERAGAAQAKLEEWLASENLAPVGAPEMAAYDPPFMPLCLRRNEIFAPLERTHSEKVP